MPNENSKDFLKDLADAVGQTLLDRIRNGEASAAELNCARQLLKDQGFLWEVADPDLKTARDLIDSLPFTDEDRVPGYSKRN